MAQTYAAILVKIFRDQRLTRMLNSTIQEQQKCNISSFTLCTKNKVVLYGLQKEHFKIKLLINF